MKQDRDKNREHDPMRRFEERWREWSRRPPRLDPSQAANRVMARLDESSPDSTSDSFLGRGLRSWTWRFAAAAAVVVLAAGLWIFLSGLPPTVTGPDSPALHAGIETTETPVMADGVVLLMLDDDTPLYMTFAPPQGDPGAQKGEGS